MAEEQLPAQQQQAQYVTGARGVNVNYGTTFRAPISRNFGGYERPSINIDIGRAMTSVVKGFAQAQAADKKKEEEVSYNVYATEVNRIVQGERQGAYTVEEASNRIRALDDQYLSMGYDPTKLAQVRVKYDGGIYSAVEAVQKKNEEAEAQRQLDSYDEFRKRYSFAQNWSNTRVESYLGELNSMEDKIQNLTKMMSNPSMTEDDRSSIKSMRDEAFKSLGIQNTMNETYKKLSENPDKPLTPNDLIVLRRNIMDDYIQHGGSIHDAAPIADSIIRSLGLDTVSNMMQQDAEHANQYIETMVKNMELQSKQDLYLTYPQLTSIVAMTPYMQEAMFRRESAKAALDVLARQYLNPVPDGEGSVTWYWKGKPVTGEEFSFIAQASTYNMQQAAPIMTYPNKLFINGNKVNIDLAKTYAEGTVLNPDLPEEDRSVAFKNLRNIGKSIEDTLRAGANRTIPEKERKELETRSSEIKWLGHYSDRTKPNADILNQLSMTDRKGGVRVMDDGTLAMIKDHPDYKAYNYFSDTHKLCEEWNNRTRDLSPEARKDLLDTYVDGLYPYNKNLDGELDDMSPQWRDKFKDFLPDQLAETKEGARQFASWAGNKIKEGARNFEGYMGSYQYDTDERRVRGEFGRELGRIKSVIDAMNENNRLNVAENQARRNGENIVTSTIEGSSSMSFPSMITASDLDAEIGRYDQYISELYERPGEDWSGVIETLRDKQKELEQQRLKMPDVQEDIKKDEDKSTPPDYEQHVNNSARQYGVEPELVDAVAFKESSRGRNIVSKDGGAIGVMQVRKPALTDAIKAGVVPAGTKLEDLKNTEIGTRVGTWYLSQQLKTFGNDVVKALAAYNQGPGWVRAAIRAAKNKDRWLEEAVTNGFTLGRKKVSPQYVRDVVLNYINPILQERSKA